jgi:hypothetical protein
MGPIEGVVKRSGVVVKTSHPGCSAGIANMAAFSREVGIPTEAGLPHAFGNAFRNIAALVADRAARSM